MNSNLRYINALYCFKKQFKDQKHLRIMKGLCDNCLTSNVEVTSVKGKTLCSVCSNKDSNK